MHQPLAGWRGYFLYRKESLKPTWTLRALLLVPLVFVVVTRTFWAAAIADSLVCREQTDRSQVLLIDNLDPDYLVFERATALHRSGIASRIVVPVMAARGSDTPNAISQGTAELMARVARLPTLELLPIEEQEPITLNAARQVRDFLTREQITAVTVVVPGFRSQRSYLAYTEALTPAGIAVRCVPVFGTKTPRNWTETWHGIQEVGLQFLKLQYYRFWVLT